jgi:hypothetical protein
LLLPECIVGDWIIKPELYRSHLGIQDRDLLMKRKYNCNIIIVYLALSSEVKVRVTRKLRFTRWIDQGAICNVSIVEV